MAYLDVILLGIVTIILAIGAYIINDVYDQQADQHNGIERVKDKRKSVITYWIFNLLGLVLSFVIAYRTQSFSLLWIYPVAIFTLYIYSRLLKGTPLMGNFIVALFCALVPGILFLAERGMITVWKVQDPLSWELHKEILWMFVLFSFLSTMYREQVKDLEDMAGDKASGYFTLPVVYGEERARTFSLFSGMLLLISICVYAAYHLSFDAASISILLILLLTVTWSIIVLSRSRSRDRYGTSSKLIKYAMLAGLLYLIIPIL